MAHHKSLFGSAYNRQTQLGLGFTERRYPSLDTKL
jgi:hypothetical protein